LGPIILTKYGKFDIVHKDKERKRGWAAVREGDKLSSPLTDPGVNDLIKPPGKPSDLQSHSKSQLVAAPPVVRQFHTFCVAMAISKVARLVKLSQKRPAYTGIHRQDPQRRSSKGFKFLSNFTILRYSKKKLSSIKNFFIKLYFLKLPLWLKNQSGKSTVKYNFKIL